ncbi:MAG: hypothetical protein NC395_07215 [Prevotella sp.]|nr:hypothetical protein [Prevotella sp.]
MKENKKIIKSLEDYGIMTAEFNRNAPMYNARKLSQYCKKKGITADKLTDAELTMLRN